MRGPGIAQVAFSLRDTVFQRYSRCVLSGKASSCCLHLSAAGHHHPLCREVRFSSMTQAAGQAVQVVESDSEGWMHFKASSADEVSASQLPLTACCPANLCRSRSQRCCPPPSPRAPRIQAGIRSSGAISLVGLAQPSHILRSALHSADPIDYILLCRCWIPPLPGLHPPHKNHRGCSGCRVQQRNPAAVQLCEAAAPRL